MPAYFDHEIANETQGYRKPAYIECYASYVTKT